MTLDYTKVKVNRTDKQEKAHKQVMKIGNFMLSAMVSEKSAEEHRKDLEFKIQNLKNEIEEQKEMFETELKGR